MAFNPMLWGTDFAHVYRDSLSATATVAVLALSGRAYLVDATVLRPLHDRVAWLAALGFTFGVYWLTREEREWIYPSLMLVLGYWFWNRLNVWRLARQDPGQPRRRLSAEAAAILIPIMAFLVPLLSVHAMNARQYGVFRDSDFRSRSFQSAYGALSRIRPEHFAPYIVLPREAQERLYAVSPVAAELRPHLELGVGEDWRLTACAMLALSDCTGVPSSHFVWALRDSVAAAGHLHSAPEGDRFFDDLTADINVACREHRLDCLPPRSGMAPPFRWRYLRDSIDAAWNYYQLVVYLGGEPIEVRQSQGDPDAIAAFVRVTGGEVNVVPDRLRAAQLAIVRRVAQAYLVVFPLLFPICVPGLFAVALRAAAKREGMAAVIFGGAILLALVARVGVVSYVYATAIPLMSSRYLAPACLLAPAFVVLVSYLASAEAIQWTAIQFRKRRSIPRPPS
jgi:hypothetical protein